MRSIGRMRIPDPQRNCCRAVDSRCNILVRAIKGNQENSERTMHGCGCLIPGSDNARYCANALLIYQPMNLGASHVYSCCTSLLRLLCGKKENVRPPANRGTLVVRKELRAHSHSPTFRVCTAICTLKLNRVLP